MACQTSPNLDLQLDELREKLDQNRIQNVVNDDVKIWNQRFDWISGASLCFKCYWVAIDTYQQCISLTPNIISIGQSNIGSIRYTYTSSQGISYSSNDVTIGYYLLKRCFNITPQDSRYVLLGRN